VDFTLNEIPTSLIWDASYLRSVVDLDCLDVQEHADRAASLCRALPSLQLQSSFNKALEYSALAERIRNNFTDVVLMGTGGSSLGAQTFVALSSLESPRIHFLENIDPFTFEKLLASLDLEKTFFVIVSKSGSTPETVSQSILLAQRLNPLWKSGLACHCIVIT
jgi:glucose-6-phosphate isomerase